MMMTIQGWFSTLRERIRVFLGLDVLPTRLEIIQLRDLIEKNHRDTLEALAKIAIRQQYPGFNSSEPQFVAPNADWDYVQRLELVNMLKNPPKED